MQPFAERFFAAANAKGGPVCVGLDPEPGKLGGRSLEDWSCMILDAVAAHVPAVKIQLACYERYGAKGIEVYERIVNHGHDRGLLVIADAKRGDIGISSCHYAATFLEGAHAADAMTVNGYLGADALEPYLDSAHQNGAGLFVLVRTSNPGSDSLQTLMLEDGRRVCEAVADMVMHLGAEYVGDSGYSLLGAVVGATKVHDLAALRQRMAHQLFLVPGYGAQGGKAKDLRACFHPDGRGAIITASRSVIYADDVAGAARRFRDEIAEVLQ
ncbi:MAG: orotidine-5'-phosphate decarboxylase [Phycisphaeraceae bacterium]|nr:orotidine-5'-phosphate decarboxylase [Phycisphaeraceae bacterium]